ncbi:MAG: prephenate dehydratase [Phycisphaerae bacterium]
MASLDELRNEIDALDEQIVALLNQRAEAAVGIGRHKKQMGAAVFTPDRERAVLNRIAELSAGPLSQQSLHAIYRELMSASFALERPPRVGYLGPEGTFTHEAAMGKFGASVEYEPLEHIRGVFDAIKRGHIDYGVVPVENNSIGGVVLDTLDAFVRHEVRVCNEIRRAIHLNLMARCPMDEIEAVHSKPEAFRQCQDWLTETGFASKVVASPSTSQAAAEAARGEKIAAIGSTMAARQYGLTILAANIEDNPKNATRFFVLGKDAAKPTGDDRTSLMFVTAHKAGALADVLLVFQRMGINMTMITSRPSDKSDVEYNFFVDIDGHAEDAALAGAIDEAGTHCRTLRVLGSYPKSTEVVNSE